MKVPAILFLPAVAVLLTPSHAQQPPPMPKMNDTFYGTGTVRVELGDRNISGTFTIARMQDSNKGIEREVFPSPAQTNTGIALLRYDKNITYYIRGEQDNPHCFTEDRNFNGMPKFWEWLSNATYAGNYTNVKKEVFDFWSSMVGGVRFELGAPRMPKPPTKSGVFYYFNRKSIDSAVFYTFTGLQEKITDKKLFDVPKYCV